MNKRILALLVLFICIVFSSCTKNQNEYKLKMPEDALALVEAYMNAYSLGTSQAIEYAHFENDFKKEAYLKSEDKLLDYIIESTEKINDNLYALTVLVKTTETSDSYLRVYNFVTMIDDKWCYINGVGNIPPDLKSNFDESKYTYRGG